MSVACHRACTFQVLTIAALLFCAPGNVFAGGFEVGNNTALSNARGGTGAASKLDPSATTINPGRLPFVRGFQIIGGSNAVDLNLRFQRDPLVRPNDVVEFEEVRNVSLPFLVPYVAASWDLGIDNLAVGVSANGPHAVGSRCFSEFVDGECVVDFSNAARHMVVHTFLIQVSFLGTIAYAFDLDAGKLGIGLSGGAAYQQSDITLVIDQASLNVGPPYTENPDFQASFNGYKLRDLRPAFVGGLAWEGKDGFRLAAAYQPGFTWEATGRVDLGLPPSLDSFVELTNDELVLRSKQAHRLTAAWGYATGTHPGRDEMPLFDLEFNVVWEDWSRVESFESEPLGALNVSDVQELPINSVVQPKGYQDTFALRVGASYATTPWLSLHGGGFIESAAQRKPLTNADFVSWERYSGSAGATAHVSDWLDITASYAYVASPARTVTDGQVYSQVPLSSCQYPDYDQRACPSPGTPPGNPQNNGDWNAHFHIAGLNLTGRF